MSNLVSRNNRAFLTSRSQDVSEPDLVEADDAGAEALRTENAELKARIAEMEQAWLDSQREYENLLEEKSEVIRGLHQKIQDLQNAEPAQIETVRPEDMLSLQEQLEEERQRLQQDEESLMVQMREMELSMAKERAELARQRTELQRLQVEFNREVELASRDAELRERLQGLQRRQQAVLQQRHEQSEARRQAPAARQTAPSDATPLPKKSNSGLLGRLFGK